MLSFIEQVDAHIYIPLVLSLAHIANSSNQAQLGEHLFIFEKGESLFMKKERVHLLSSNCEGRIPKCMLTSNSFPWFYFILFYFFGSFKLIYSYLYVHVHAILTSINSLLVRKKNFANKQRKCYRKFEFEIDSFVFEIFLSPNHCRFRSSTQKFHLISGKYNLFFSFSLIMIMISLLMGNLCKNHENKDLVQQP